MRRQEYAISNFYCTDCNMKFPLARKKARQREMGHIKDLWCPCCGMVKKFVEIRSVDFRPFSS